MKTPAIALALVAFLSAITHVTGISPDHTKKTYLKPPPVLVSPKHNPFLHLPLIPDETILGNDAFKLVIPPVFDRYVWDLFGFFRAYESGEHTFSIESTELAIIQFGWQRKKSSLFVELLSPEKHDLTRTPCTFMAEKGQVYPISIRLIGKNKRAPVYVTVDGVTQEVREQIVHIAPDENQMFCSSSKDFNTNTGFYCTRLMPDESMSNEDMLQTLPIDVVQSGFENHSYQRIGTQTISSAVIVEISGYLRPLVDGIHTTTFTDGYRIVVQIGPKVEEKRNRYLLDSSWTIFSDRDYDDYEVNLDSRFYYPFRLVTFVNIKDFEWGIIVTDPSGNQVDLFGFSSGYVQDILEISTSSTYSTESSKDSSIMETMTTDDNALSTPVGEDIGSPKKNDTGNLEKAISDDPKHDDVGGIFVSQDDESTENPRKTDLGFEANVGNLETDPLSKITLFYGDSMPLDGDCEEYVESENNLHDEPQDSLHIFVEVPSSKPDVQFSQNTSSVKIEHLLNDDSSIIDERNDDYSSSIVDQNIEEITQSQNMKKLDANLTNASHEYASLSLNDEFSAPSLVSPTTAHRYSSIDHYTVSDEAISSFAQQSGIDPSNSSIPRSLDSISVTELTHSNLSPSIDGFSTPAELSLPTHDLDDIVVKPRIQQKQHFLFQGELKKDDIAPEDVHQTTERFSFSGGPKSYRKPRASPLDGSSPQAPRKLVSNDPFASIFEEISSVMANSNLLRDVEKARMRGMEFDKDLDHGDQSVRETYFDEDSENSSLNKLPKITPRKSDKFEVDQDQQFERKNGHATLHEIEQADSRKEIQLKESDVDKVPLNQKSSLEKKAGLITSPRGHYIMRKSHRDILESSRRKSDVKPVLGMNSDVCSDDLRNDTVLGNLSEVATSNYSRQKAESGQCSGNSSNDIESAVPGRQKSGASKSSCSLGLFFAMLCVGELLLKIGFLI